ncbi:MAG: 1-acyl-sn-glycerol-3-phosphate acyltransferase [Candidatus Pelagibacter sp. TMED275]|nr:MAG: 1-acyl-sn-glycerol-3-phosphate acyltransferase [Candidatus Pelagibacter sp. TMED275]|tara:strand:+ start:30 stop:731 length:702 start_codon:yes stop_codon:yes gene_type:complete
MIRSFLFKIFFFLGIVIISIIYLPSLFLKDKVAISGGKLMGYWCSFCLKFFLSTNIKIEGVQNIIVKGKFFIACSHQSMFETFFLQTIFNGPVFILKKELIKIPIFGNYLKKIGAISIDRNKITKENIGFTEKISRVINDTSRPVLIFPQGTRTKPKEYVEFKKGVSRIYNDLNIKCQPIAINSGNVWPKNNKLETNRTITVSILPAINEGIDKNTFLNLLEKQIYEELEKLN